MSYVSKKEKVFDLPEQEDSSSISLKGTETRLKRFPSVSDRRAWTSEENQRYQHLYGLVNGNESNISKSSSFKYIPFDVLLAILMAEKDAYIQELLDKQDDSRPPGDRTKLLYKSEGFDDSDDDRDALIRKDAEMVSLKNKIAGLESELEDCRDTLTKAMHKLESMDAIMSENNLLKEKLKYSEETIRCLEAKKVALEKELEHYKGNLDNPKAILETGRVWDGGDNEQLGSLSSDILIRQIQKLQQQLDETKANETEVEVLKKTSEAFSNKFEEVVKENETFKRKLESMKCLEKNINDLKKQAQILTEKYRRESQKANDQLKLINMNAKELELLREERDRLLIRVSELTAYESQYISLQAKLHQVELIIDENEMLNRKLDRLEMENEQLNMKLEVLKSAEIQGVQEKEKTRKLQWAAGGQEEDFRKMLRNFDSLSESVSSYMDKNEVEQLRVELDEKNEKLKKYEKQLTDIPFLESEVDLLRNKLQKCIDDFKTEKDLLRRLQEELEACRKRCHELEEMAPLYQTDSISSCNESLKRSAEKAKETARIYSETGVNTAKITVKETDVQSSLPDSADKSTLIIDQAVKNLERAEEQNQILKNEVANLTAKLSKINLEELLTQTNELKKILETKDQKIHELITEVNSIRKELKSYETLKQNLEEETVLLKENFIFINQELELKNDYVKELQESLELERKGREFAKNMIKTLEEKLEEEAQKKEMGDAVLKLQKEETNCAKQEIYQYFGKEVDHLKGIICMSRKLNKELETENELLREAKEYFEKTQNRALKNLIVKLRAELTVLKSLSKPELERECHALQHQVKSLLKETDNLVDEIRNLKAALDSEKNVKDFLEKEVLSLQAELTACVTSGNEVFGREISEKEATITKLQEKLAKAENDLENSKNETQTLRDANEKLIENVYSLESEQKYLKNQINLLRMQEDELNKNIKLLQERSMMELEEKEKECLEKARSLEEAFALVENLKKELASKEKLLSTNALEEAQEFEEALTSREESSTTKEQELKEAPNANEESLKAKEQDITDALKAKEEEMEKCLKAKDEEMEKCLKAKDEEMEKCLKAKEEEMEEYLKTKEKEMEECLKAEVEEAIKSKEEELESVRKVSLNAADELNKLCSEMEVLKSRLAETDEKTDSTEVQDVTRYERDLEENSALEGALRKIENELDELKQKQLKCRQMEEEMENLRAERDSLLEKMSGFENEIENLNKKLSDFETLKNELMQLKAKKKSDVGDDLEVSRLYQEVLEQKTQITNLRRENESLKEDLSKSEGLLDVYKHLQNKTSECQMPPTTEFFTPPTLLSPRSSGPQDFNEEKITLEAHKKEIQNLELIYEQKIQFLKDSNMEKLRKLSEQHEKECKVRTRASYENINSIKASYENDIKKLVEKHKLSFMRLQGLHEDEVQELNTTYETQMEAMQTQNENLINDLRTESAEKLKQLREQQNRDMRELTRKYEDLLRKSCGLQSNGDFNASSKDVQEAEDVTQYYQNRITEMEEKHNQELKKCKKSNLKRIELMKNKYEALLVEERKKYEQQLEEMLLQLRNGQEGVQTDHVHKKVPTCVNPRLEFHEVLQKILNEGLECLTFEELILVHSKTCFVPEVGMKENEGGGEYLSKKSGKGCKHRELMAAEKEELLKRIFTLEHEIVIKQLETHEAIVNMEAAEMLRIQELKRALCVAQQKNIELKRLLSDQSKHEMNLKIDRYMSDKQATFHETNVVEKVKELERERADKKRLEEELQKEKACVKNLTMMMEAERERHQIHRKRDSEYVESMRQRLEEALNHEQMMETQLDYEVKLRLRLEAEMKNFHENWKSELPPPSPELDVKPLKSLNNKDQNEVSKESKHGRSKSRRRSRLKSIND